MPFKKGTTVMLGRKLSEETRRKMSEAHKKLKPSDWGAGFKPGNEPWNKREKVSRNAYYAGLTDGEGFISIQGNSPDKTKYQRVVVRISMQKRSCLEEAHQTWGGYIYERNRPEQTQYFEWVLQHGKAEKFLLDIFPFLKEKREQAEIALRLRFLQTRRREGTNQIYENEQEYRKELEVKLKSLHLKKGVQPKISS